MGRLCLAFIIPGCQIKPQSSFGGPTTVNIVSLTGMTSLASQRRSVLLGRSLGKLEEVRPRLTSMTKQRNLLKMGRSVFPPQQQSFLHGFYVKGLSDTTQRCISKGDGFTASSNWVELWALWLQRYCECTEPSGKHSSNCIVSERPFIFNRINLYLSCLC